MNPEKLPLQSADGSQLNLDALYQIAPSCFTEAKGSDGKVRRVVNFDVLRQLLGDAAADTGEEFYQFTWPGKAEARREAARSIRKTLRPVPEDSVDWDTTQNLYIEGDNLEVLKLLQKSYMGKIKMIYIDPPYNTGNDFVYNDDFAASAADHDRVEGNIDELGNRYRKNTESNGHYHSDWCSMMYSRLKISRSLLSDDGVIFISIDDNEVENLKKIGCEIFGSSNFVGELIHQRAKGGGQAKYVVKGHDYILVFAKTIGNISLARKKVIQKKTVSIDGDLYIINDDIIRKTFGKYDKSLGDRRCFYEELEQYKGIDKKIEIDAQIQAGNLFLKENSDGLHMICRYEKVSEATSKLYTIIKVLSEEGKKELDELGIVGFSYPKPTEIIRQLVEAGANDENAIVLDFFSGSATTAHAIMKLNAEDGGNRKFIMVQLPEQTYEDSEARKAGYDTICEIGKERIRRAGRKIKQEAGLQGQSLDTGFRVFRVDESNMEDVYFQPAALSQDKLELLLDNVRPDRTDLDLLFGAILDWGVKLSLPMSKATIDGCDVYTVNDGDLVACFADNITENVIAHIADQSPLRVLFRDSCFNSDADKINIFEQFKQRLGWSDEEAMKNIRVI